LAAAQDALPVVAEVARANIPGDPSDVAIVIDVRPVAEHLAAVRSEESQVPRAAEAYW
jgi:hypothetical protein